MKTKQTIGTEQEDTERKQTAQSKQSEEVPRFDSIDPSDDTTEKSPFIIKYVKVLMPYYFFALSVGMLAIGISAIFTLTFLNRTQLITHKDIIEIVQAVKSQKTSEVEEYVRKIEQDPSTSVMNKAITEAYRLQRVGKIDEAIEKWHAIAIVTEDVDDDLAINVWFAIGHLHQVEARAEQALSAYDRAIQLDPDNVTAYVNRGTVNIELGQYKEAVSDFDEAIRLNPSYADAYVNRGTVNIELGQYKEAVSDFDEAIRLNPSYADAYVNRGTVNIELGQYRAAIADFNRALLMQPNDAKAYINRGTVNIELGQYKEAVSDFDEAIRLNPSYADAYVNRGMTNKKLGNIEAAKVDFQTALELVETTSNEIMKTAAKQHLQELNNME